jgi:hypothetical protein
MLTIQCDKCHLELREPGALVFSPPTTETWLVEKYHICIECWSEVAALLHVQKPSDAK